MLCGNFTLFALHCSLTSSHFILFVRSDGNNETDDKDLRDCVARADNDSCLQNSGVLGSNKT